MPAKYVEWYLRALADAVELYRRGDDRLEGLLRVELGQDPAVAMSPVGVMSGWARLHAAAPDILEGAQFRVQVIGPDEETRNEVVRALWWAGCEGPGDPNVVVVVAPEGGWLPEHVPVIERAGRVGVPVVVTLPEPGQVVIADVPQAVAAIAVTDQAPELTEADRVLRRQWGKMRALVREDPAAAAGLAEALGVRVPGIQKRFVWMWAEMLCFGLMSVVVAVLAGAPPLVLAMVGLALVWRGVKLRKHQAVLLEKELARAVDRYLGRRLGVGRG